MFGNPVGYQIKGDLFVKGQKRNFRRPQDAIKAGMAYVTEDRKGNGLILIRMSRKISRWRICARSRITV